jgi:maltose alpha-D-glucosyltransferase/alpha-amylase
MPFFPSPLRDDGYDIADYNAVHSSYGTLEDFRKFLGSAHDRGIRIIIEMVSNHTSDQHPWFQESRSYDAKFDGKDYPIQGDPGHTTVSLKRIGDDTIEETDKRDGKIVGVYRMTVSSDGKSIHAEYTDKERETTTTFTMEKQS